MAAASPMPYTGLSRIEVVTGIMMPEGRSLRVDLPSAAIDTDTAV